MGDREETLGKLVDHQKTVYLSSIDSEGYPCTRAMLPPRKREGLKYIFFSTNTSSSKVAQFRLNPKASLYFCDRRFFRGLMLKGKVEVLEEANIKEEIWENGDTMYYPLGVTDPDYCVLRFTTESARYYSNFHSEDIFI